MDDDSDLNSAEVIEFPKERIVRMPKGVAIDFIKEKVKDAIEILIKILDAG